MIDLHIIVNNKIATYQKRDGCIVCGNNDYQVKFTFDDEWSAHDKKIARFIWGGQFQDVEFTGDTCPVPILSGVTLCEVGCTQATSAQRPPPLSVVSPPYFARTQPRS